MVTLPHNQSKDALTTIVIIIIIIIIIIITTTTTYYYYNLIPSFFPFPFSFSETGQDLLM